MFDDIRMGIPKPEKEPASIDEMRLAIDRAGRDSSLIRSSLEAARYQGKSGEDTHVMLAYYALRELERQYRMNLRWLSVTPASSIVMPVEESPTQETGALCPHGKPVDDTEHQCRKCGPVESG